MTREEMLNAIKMKADRVKKSVNEFDITNPMEVIQMEVFANIMFGYAHALAVDYEDLLKSKTTNDLKLSAGEIMISVLKENINYIKNSLAKTKHEIDLQNKPKN